jgi:hypothetical protein
VWIQIQDEARLKIMSTVEDDGGVDIIEYSSSAKLFWNSFVSAFKRGKRIKPTTYDNLYSWWTTSVELLVLNRSTDGPSSLKPGKWVLFTTKDEVDKVWEKIVTEDAQGHLVCYTKVATSINEELEKHLICVYVDNSQNLPVCLMF